MARNQFLKIQRYFHINNPENDPSRIKDKEKSKVEQDSNLLYKVNPLLEPVRQNCKKQYNMHQHVSVDEAMIQFGGQHASSVGAPNKPAKRGFKIFCICDAVTGYLYDFQVYHRKKKEI